MTDRADLTNALVVHYDEYGRVQVYCTASDVRLIHIDDRAPNDRVFEQTTRNAAEELEELIANDPIRVEKSVMN